MASSWKKALLKALLVCPLLLGVGMCSYFTYQPRIYLGRLLRGDNQIHLSGLIIAGQGKRVDFSDAASLTYLSEAFRAASPEGARMGYSFTGTFSFGRFLSYDTDLYLAVDRNEITIAMQPFDNLAEPKHYRVQLPEPIPDRVSRALRHLRPPLKPGKP
jgi:hypothetical protein